MKTWEIIIIIFKNFTFRISEKKFTISKLFETPNFYDSFFLTYKMPPPQFMKKGTFLFAANLKGNSLSKLEVNHVFPMIIDNVLSLPCNKRIKMIILTIQK